MKSFDQSYTFLPHLPHQILIKFLFEFNYQPRGHTAFNVITSRTPAGKFSVLRLSRPEAVQELRLPDLDSVMMRILEKC